MVQVGPITNDVDLLRLNRRTLYRYVVEGLIRYDDQIRNPVRATLEKKQCLSDQGTAALSKLCIEQFRAEIVLVIHKLLPEELERRSCHDEEIRRIGCMQNVEAMPRPNPEKNAKATEQGTTILENIRQNTVAFPRLPIPVNPYSVDNLKTGSVSAALSAHHIDFVTGSLQRSSLLPHTPVLWERPVFEEKYYAARMHDLLRCGNIGYVGTGVHGRVHD
jgi:hypothetical protein